MNCPKCNTPLQDGVQFCPNCGYNLVDNTSNNTEPVAPVQNIEMNSSNNISAQDKVNVWLVILSWFIPLAGLIIFIVKKKTSPKTAKASGISALTSAILSMIFLILGFVFLFGTLNFVVEEGKSQAEEIIEDAYEQIEDVEDFIQDNNEQSTNSESNSSSSSNVEVSKDWKLYQIGINGSLYTLPMSYNDLKTASGFALKDDQVNLTVPNNHYGLGRLYKNDKYALYVELYNNTGAEIKYTDAKVTRISQTKYQVSQGADAIIFPGGIKAGDSITDAQLVNLFGTANDIKDYGTRKQYLYVSDTTWTTTNNFKIIVVDGVIDEIQLDNRK